MEERSDSLEDDRIEYLPFDFPFAIYQTPLYLPSPKRQRPSPLPFPYFDLNSPTFGIVAPPLSMQGPTSTIASSVSFTAESSSPTQTSGMVTPQRTRDPDVSVNVNPTVSSLRVMVSTMLGTPLGFNITSTPFTTGVSHSSNVGPSFTLTTVDPSIPQTLGAQPGIGSRSLLSLSTLLLHATPFPGTLSMCSSPQIGSAPLQQNNLVLNQQNNAQFTPGSVGLFHPSSGGFPPFLGDNLNPNPTSGSSYGLPFEWNWNENISQGPQNVGLAFSGSSSQQLGNNPSFGLVGVTDPLGQQPTGSQPISTLEQSVGFNPYSAQPLGGTMGFSQQPLGQVQSSSHFQQMGGSNALLNPSMQFGKVPQQPPHLGEFIPNSPYQQPNAGASNIPLTATHQGGSNYQPGWNQPGVNYAYGGPQTFGNAPFTGGYNPSQQVGFAIPYTNQPQMGGYTQFPDQMSQNPQQGMYQNANQNYSRMPHGGSGLHGNQYPYNQNTHNLFAPTNLPFLATLELLYFSKLTNDPIRHHFAWPPVPVKIPTNIPKFDRKTGEDPANHITTYHLWCVSNSFLEDSINLWLFPRTLTDNAEKWFIELPSTSFFDFQSLAIAFLTRFQLPIWYETSTEILTSL